MSRAAAQILPRLPTIRSAMVPHIVDDPGSFCRVGCCHCHLPCRLNKRSTDPRARCKDEIATRTPRPGVGCDLALSFCVYPVPEPAPYEYVAAAPTPPVAYRRCAPGWHWVRARHTPSGAWVRGRCARNWVKPPVPPREPPPPTPAAPPE